MVFMLAFSFLPVERAGAAQAYSEGFTGYVAGSSALWFLSFGGINASSPAISSVEGIQGVSWYNLTAVKTTGMSADAQIFGPSGYNLFPIPFVPSQGAFLTVGADTYADASSAAAYLGGYLLTAFVSYSNSSGTYTFYAPLSFGDIAPPTLLKFIPTSMGGFASAVKASTFATLPSPIVTLAGVREGSGFAHTLTIGSTVGGALASSSSPDLLKYFGTSMTSLKASNKSTSSTINFRFLDGFVRSNDTNAVVRNTGGTGFYSLSLGAGKKVVSVNATVVQAAQLLLAQRVIDTGVLMPNHNVSVTISFSVPVGLSNITTRAFSDDWWKSYGFFKLVKGNSTIPSQSVFTGGSTSPTYVLNYTGGTPQRITIPPTAVAYSYTVGTRNFDAQTMTNPVALSLGTDEPVIFAYVSPASSAGNYGGPVGSTQRFTVTAKNVGTLTAPTVNIAGSQKSGLVAGATASATVSLTAQDLLDINSSHTFSVVYSTPGGQSFNVTTNPIPVVFSHSSMAVALPTLALGVTVSSLGSGNTNLTLSLTAADQGVANATGYVATGSLPAGLSCGTVSGTGLACSGSTVTYTLSSLGAGKTKTASMEFNLTAPMNYFFTPFSYSAKSGTFSLGGTSNAVAAPSGVVLAKRFASSALFGAASANAQGMLSKVYLSVSNAGPFHLYNSTVQSTADAFDAITSTSSVPLKSAQDIGPGSNLTASYTIAASNDYGNWSSSPAALRMYFGGALLSLTEPGPTISVYQPLTVNIATSPTAPTEGRAFSILVTIQNPSGVSVSDVEFSLPIPGAMSLSQLRNASTSGKNLVVSTSQLGPHASYSANVTASASSGISVLFRSGNLTFSYAGSTIQGSIPNKAIVVGEDVLTRYTLPTVLVLLALLAAVFYVRRKAAPTAPSSRQ